MSTQSTIDENPLTNDAAVSMQARGSGFLIQGAFMIVLGILAVALPVLSTFAVETLIGWLFIVGGVWRVISLTRSARMPGFRWSLAMAIVAIVLGAMLLVMPLSGVLALTTLLMGFFVLEAIGKILFGLDLYKHSYRWGWALASGILDLVLAALIFARWPSAAVWAIGLLVGVNMIFFGLTLAMISLTTSRSGDLTVNPKIRI